MNKKRMSKSIVALALAAAMALTGCDAADDDPNGTVDPGTDVTTTTVPMETTTTAAG